MVLLLLSTFNLKKESNLKVISYFDCILFLVTNGITSQSKVKVKHLKPNQVHKMVASKKTLATFPKTSKKNDDSSVRIDKKTKSSSKTVFLKEELLDDLDEMNEDHINLLKDAELLQTIEMTENDMENKYGSDNMKEEQEVNIYDSVKLSKSKDNL